MFGSAFIIGGLNRMIERETGARDALREHVSETALLGLGPVVLRFRVTDTALLEVDHNVGEPTVSIEVPSSALAHAFDGPDALARHARVSGDARLAETIAQLLKYLRPDVGALLSPITGDIVANRVERALTSATATTRNTARNLGANLYEYVSEEAGLVVKRTELESLQDDMARVRDDLARLEKRIERLGGNSTRKP
ncbi:MAG: hypothetical protein QM803_04610 [Rhodocyclaceae bacterium]